MAVDKVIIGRKYKFDNKKFYLENRTCYGISQVDRDFLFNSNILIFLSFDYLTRKFTPAVSSVPTDTVIIYCKGMKGHNISTSNIFNKKVWEASSNILKYLSLLEEFVQEEMDV